MKPSTRPIGAVVCDLDGTLIDTERVFAEAARRLLACRGKKLEVDFLGSIQGTPGRDALPRFRQRFGLDEPLVELAAEYKRHFVETLAGRLPPLMPGVVALLDRLEARRIPCAIATSSRREYVDNVFGPHGLLQRFDFILTADDVTHGKPHPEIYEKAVARLSLPALEIAVIEDSPAGLQAALAAGTRCIVVPHSNTPRDQIVGAHAVVQSLHDPDLWGILGIGSG
jgi:HAD superfamily hydrolase (TIGR01509 family)